jgi:tetratricopeptide (TPR) repeat protein
MSLELLTIEYNKATALHNKDQNKKAMPIFIKCLKDFKFKEALINLGNCYKSQGDYKKMMKCYIDAADPDTPCLDPDGLTVTVQALTNLGLGYFSFGDNKKAIHYLTKAIKLNNKAWPAWWNLAITNLKLASSGDLERFAKGWEMYDARFLKTPPIKLKNNKEGLIYWDTIAGGNSIIVLAEQGIGDNIMWGRYLPELRKKFDRVYIQCDPSLNPLFPGYDCVTDAVECDVEVAYPLCSLAKCFNNGVPIDGNWLEGKFDTRSFPTDTFNVGIVWAGSTSHVNNINRSVSIGRFSRLANYANLYSLSPDFKSTKQVKSLGIKSWTDTAECINGLDLVIGVDTSVMHLCGSLGRPGWVLQPSYETDFRWGTGAKSVWYSSIDVYQNDGWENVFDRVENDLKERLYEKC